MIFQTIVNNRILTPSIIGLDSLYVLLQTILIFIFSGLGYSSLDANGKFMLEVCFMILLALLLFLPLFSSKFNLHQILLIGIIISGLFRSLNGLLQLLMDPNDFAVLQYANFANFSQAKSKLLLFSTLLIIVGLYFIWKRRHALDILAINNDLSISLGISWNRLTLILLLIVAVLTAVSTALVDPVAFFGLLTANLGYYFIKNYRHSILIPAIAMISGIMLVYGHLF